MKQNTVGLEPVGAAIFSLNTLGRLSCSELERKLKQVPGIADVNVNYAVDTIQVKFDPGKVSSEDVRALMKKLGYATSQRS